MFVAICFISAAVATACGILYKQRKDEQSRQDALAKARQDTGWHSAADFHEPADPSLYFRNADGQRLQVAAWLPPGGATEIRAALAFFHGYGASAHHPCPAVAFKGLAAQGIAVVAFDQAGHGHSEGERAHVSDANILVRDAWAFTRACFAGGKNSTVAAAAAAAATATTATATAESNTGSTGSNSSFEETPRIVGFAPDVADRLASVPFFVSGASMGGGVALAWSLEAQTCVSSSGGGAESESAEQQQQQQNPDDAEWLDGRWRGTLLYQPLVAAGKVPPKPVVWLLENIVAPLLPLQEIPSLIEPVNDVEALFLHRKWQQASLIDTWPHSKTGHWGRNMRFSTAVALLNFTRQLERSHMNARFPFIIFHDPEDEIVEAGPSWRMVEGAPSADKTAVRCDNLRHDTFSADPDMMMRESFAWMQTRI